MEDIIKKWKILGYELKDDLYNDLHFIKEEESKIYKLLVNHIIIDKAFFVAFSNFSYSDDFFGRQYIRISFELLNLIYETMNLLNKMKKDDFI